MKKSIIAMSIVAASTFQIANACTTWVTDTTHGTTVIRSVDWGTKLGGVAHALPKGTQQQSDDVKGYKQAASWTVKYQTMNIEEYESFHGAAISAINAESGLSVNGQYMEDSKPFLSLHQDSGAPAVALANVASYIASNFATAEEAKTALENGQFQIAWAAGLAGAEHGVHFSVQDKNNNKLLIQLGEGGKQKMYFNDADLRSMTNAPLQDQHRDYVKDLDMQSSDTIMKMSAHISSKERNARLLYMSDKVDLMDKSLSYEQVEGKMLGIFDRAVLVPQDLIDPDNGETYATWISYLYNFEQGTFKFRNHETYNDIRLNLEDVKVTTTEMCADLVEQADAGYQEVKWSACASVIPSH